MRAIERATKLPMYFMPQYTRTDCECAGLKTVAENKHTYIYTFSNLAGYFAFRDNRPPD